jgi:hypothetical protein
MIRALLDSVDSARPIDALASELIARCGAPNLPLLYYTRERLFSAQARADWMVPDLKALSLPDAV